MKWRNLPIQLWRSLRGRCTKCGGSVQYSAIRNTIQHIDVKWSLATYCPLCKWIDISLEGYVNETHKR